MQTAFNWTTPVHQPQPVGFMTVAPWSEPSFREPAALEDSDAGLQGMAARPSPAVFDENVGALFETEEHLLFSGISSADGWEDCHQAGGSTTDILALEDPCGPVVATMGQKASTLLNSGVLNKLSESVDTDISIMGQGSVPSGSGGSGHATDEGFDLTVGPRQVLGEEALGVAAAHQEEYRVANYHNNRDSLSQKNEKGFQYSEDGEEEVENGGAATTVSVAKPSQPQPSPPTSRFMTTRSSTELCLESKPRHAAEAPRYLRKRIERHTAATPRITSSCAGGGGGGGKKRRRKQTASRRTDGASSDEEADVSLAFSASVRRQAAAAAAGAHPQRMSRRLQARAVMRPHLGRSTLDSDFITYDDTEEPPPSPDRGKVSTAPTSSRKVIGSRAGRRTVPLAAQRIRATSARHEHKGRPSFSEIVDAGFMRPGPHRFAVGNVDVSATVCDDGAIVYGSARYRAISKFALVVLRERNPSRQSCDGWKEVAWNGEKLDALRVRVQQHARQQARQRAVQEAASYK